MAVDSGREELGCEVCCCEGIGFGLSLQGEVDSEAKWELSASNDTNVPLDLSGRGGGDFLFLAVNAPSDLVFRVNHRELRLWFGICSRMLVADLEASESRPFTLACSTKVPGRGCSSCGLRLGSPAKVCRFWSWAFYKKKMVRGFHQT